MSTSPSGSRSAKKANAQALRERSRKRKNLALLYTAGVLLFVAGLYLTTRDGAHHATGHTRYDIGSPGTGQKAPPITLESTAGGTFDLTSARAKGPVLVYFQEGLTCQPCWDQIKAIEKDATKFHKLGIRQIVSITSDPLAEITQKAADDRLTTPILSDPGLTVSKTYNAQSYGMMNGSRDGHTFILINRDGTIRWRADYGGPPNFTMFVNATELLAEIAKASSA